MRLIIFAVAAALATQATAATRDFTPAERKSALAAAAAVRDQFDAELFDYPTARFRTVIAAYPHDAKGARLCGFVNSKNRMGAYTGWVPFAVLADRLTFSADMVAWICDPTENDLDTRDYSSDLKFR